MAKYIIDTKDNNISKSYIISALDNELGVNVVDVKDYNESIDDKSVYIWLRNKTACGLYDAKNLLNQLIKAVRHKPIFRTDYTLELIYKEKEN